MTTDNDDKIDQYIQRRQYYNFEERQKNLLDKKIKDAKIKRSRFKFTQFIARLLIFILLLATLAIMVKIYAIIYYLKVHSPWFAALMFRMGH